jgi:hypothetical protein
MTFLGEGKVLVLPRRLTTEGGTVRRSPSLAALSMAAVFILASIALAQEDLRTNCRA